jgi:multiple sugar transport system ATP-binding protein
VDVFLFDEPLSNLDAKLRSELRVEIKRLHSRLNNTMVYVTHDQIEALTLADRIAVMKGGVIQQLADPQTIYNKPSNLFVAGFIGSPPMNFLPGQIIEGGKTFQFGESRISLAGYDGGSVIDRDQAILGVRPEHITVSQAQPEGPSIPAVVEIDEHLGADSLLWLKAGTKNICVRVPVEGRLPGGTRVHLGLDIAKASLFDAKSEQRI